MEHSSTVSIRNGTTQTFSVDMICDRYYSAETYKMFKVFSVFGGVLDCFVINFVILLVCILLFSFLRKRAGDYGRIGLNRRIEDGNLDKKLQAYNVWATMFVSDDQGGSGSEKTRYSFDFRLLMGDEGLFSWIPNVFRIQDIDIYRRCGADAMQYLTFQKYLIVYQMVVVVISMAIVLPVNFTQGNSEGTNDAFSRTTILNIDPNSPILWLHCALCLFLLLMAIVFMRHFIESVREYNNDEVPKAVMIWGVPLDRCFRHFIEDHFDEAYPECEITDVQFAYNVTRLISLEFARHKARTALIGSQINAEETGERPRIMPFCCGAVVQQFSRCCTCCGCQKWEVDAIDHYKEQLAMYQELCDAEKVNSFHEPLGIVFVTFVHELMTERVLKDFRVTWCGHKSSLSSHSRQMDVRNWRVEAAPSPDDIFWQNLSTGRTVWWVRAFAVNLVVLLFVIFCSTPSVFLNQFNRMHKFESETKSNIVLQFIPTLILTISSTILPTIVSCSDVNLVKHYTRSSLNHSIMVKVFIFLLLMVLFLPSAGFSSLGSVIAWFSSGQRNFKFRWDCMLVSKNCAFFTNYLISASTVGIGMEFLRIADLILYCLMWTFSKSPAERPTLQKYILSEFRYGICYAWILCNFTVNMAYSIVAPVITVPGLIYLVLKHFSDRHSLCFVFKSSKIDNRIHEAAINFVMMSVFCLQLTVLSFILLRTDKFKAIYIFAMVTLETIAILFLLLICCGKMTPPKPHDVHWDMDMEVSDHGVRDEQAPSFLPAVLENNYEEEGYIPTNLPYVTSLTADANRGSLGAQRKSSSRISSEIRSRERATKSSRSSSRIRGKSGKRGSRRSEAPSSEAD